MPKPIIQGPYRTFRRLNEHETFLEFEGSTITIDLKARRDSQSAWMHEELKLRAFMRLEIFPPYINNLGTREFQFIIRDWWLNGKSEMLSELFYDDPRGYWLGKPDLKSQYDDYVPATVTFRVSNNYDIEVDEDAGISACDLFASASELEIRNLTSHHLRTWTRFEERRDGWSYSLPSNRIYWQILPAAQVRKAGLAAYLDDKDEGPFIVFHKKPPADGRFDIGRSEDRANTLLAMTSLRSGGSKGRGPTSRFIAKEPLDGLTLEALRVQQIGNVTLSPLYRPRRGLEVHWGLGRGMDGDKLNDRLKKGPISGAIRMASPSRSLGTADYGPMPGEPLDSSDFPARITYAINYSIAINREEFVEDQAGIAIAVGVDDVPPRDVTVAFDKPHIGHVLHRFLEFGPGHCTGMHEISQGEYDHGVNFCRYWRGVPLDPDDPAWASFEDFDPSREY